MNAIILNAIIAKNSKNLFPAWKQDWTNTKITSQKMQKNHPIQEIEPLQNEATAW